MPNKRYPRHGSMQYWPRKRAKRSFARVRSFPKSDEAKPSAFAGYKVGMTHILITDNKKTSKTKGQNISVPVTIIECPPIKSASIIFYKKTTNGLQAASAVMASNLDKELKRRISIPKKTKKLEDFKPEDYEDIRVLVYTQPKLTTIGKKKPELFEIALGGKITEKYEWAKNNLGKEIPITDILKQGQQVDIHAVTKGKGFQGPVKRFGVAIRARKSEKTKRGPGSLGAWKAQGHMMYRIAHAGQMGYHIRTEHNKWIIKIGDKSEEINRKSGFKYYGVIKNPFILIKGSVAGPSKRMIIMINAERQNKKISAEAPEIKYISK